MSCLDDIQFNSKVRVKVYLAVVLSLVEVVADVCEEIDLYKWVLLKYYEYLSIFV
jgi:hypothetical protein